jgi:hypothetical protein
LCVCLAACRLDLNDAHTSPSPGPEATPASTATPGFEQTPSPTPTPTPDPVVNAGADLHIKLGDEALLSGSVSDELARAFSYSWSFAGLPHDSALGNASIRGANGLLAGFVPDVDGSYYLDFSAAIPGLTVTDRVTVTVDYDLNRAPTAFIAFDSTTFQPGQTINVNPSISDPDADAMTCLLTIKSQPAGSSLSFPPDPSVYTGFNNPHFILIPQVQGSYTLALTVTDSRGAQAYQEETIKVKAKNVSGNTSPLANAGEDFYYIQSNGTTIQTMASSYDLDGDALSYSWRMVSHPPAYPQARAEGFLKTDPGLTVQPDIPAGVYVYELTVNDGTVQGEGDEPPTDTDTVAFTVLDVPASISSARSQSGTVAVGSQATLSVEMAYDPDIQYGLPDSVSFAFVSRPASSASVLSFNPSPIYYYGQYSATFTPDVAGTYIVLATFRDFEHVFTRIMSVSATEDEEGVIDVSVY